MVEVGSGLNYLKENGQWLPSREVIEIFQDGAVARQGQHQVIWAPNLNTAGCVDLLMSDGRRLRSHVLGLAYTDSATGHSELIAEPKDCIGAIAGSGPNQVIYSDAFSGPVHGDVVYLYSVGGLEQFVILKDNPPSPAEYQCNPETTFLEVWTEFIEAPEPTRRSSVLRAEQDPIKRGQMFEPDLTDDSLDFGPMIMGLGAAFAMDGFPLGQVNDNAITSGKSWVHSAGRVFLVEKVDYRAIQPELARLPKAAAVVRKPAGLMAAGGKAARPFPARRNLPAAVPRGNPMQAAKARLPSKGLVLDYTLLNSATNFLFKGDTTYYLSNKTLTLGGTTVLEGGAVIKYSQHPSANRVLVTGTLDCRTGPCRPAFFVASDDDSVGESITGSSGAPGANPYATRAMELGASGGVYDLHDLHFRNHQKAITCSGSGVIYTLSHSQIGQTGIGFYNLSLNGNGYVRNVLLHDCSEAIHHNSTSTNYLEHVTTHRVGYFRGLAGAGAVYATNCLLISTTNNVAYTGSSADVVSNLSDANIFQTVGSATHYLATNSAYRNSGTTNVNPTLASELKSKTTYPPLILTNPINGDTLLTVQAQRDTDAPDIGFHYDALDFVASQVAVSNATLTLGTGTVLGIYGGSAQPGLVLLDGAKLISEGTPTDPNRLVRYNLVQEQAVTNWSASTVGRIVSSPSPYATNLLASELRLRFTYFGTPAGGSDHLFLGATNLAFSLRDCEFHGGSMRLWEPDVGITNCLFDRTYTEIYANHNPFNVAVRNCTFFGSLINATNNKSGTWLFKDNLIDHPTLGQSGTMTGDYNAYVTNATRITPNGVHDVLLAVTNVTYDSIAGRFFFLQSSSALINAGSQNATNAGLWHFTTLTNQVKETNTTVDIGFHYVALNASLTTAADSDGDGRPDYVEDGNGNGSLDSGETDWNNAGDWGLRVFITRPRRGAIIP
jgi:hypothetical protein